MSDQKPEQYELFPLDEIPKAEKPKDFHWYYVTRRNDTEMLAKDQRGNWIWIPHEIQHVIPHVCNTPHQAKLLQQRCGGQAVRMCRFRYIGGKRVSFSYP